MALVRDGAPHDGLPFLDRARRLAPHDPLAALWHGIGLFVVGQLDAAAAALRDAVRLDPRDPAPPIHLCRCLLRADRPAEALAAARTALALAPTLPEAIHAFRSAEFSLLRTEPAASPETLTAAGAALGRASLHLNLIQEAHAALADAAALDPAAGDAAVPLALVEYLRGRPRAAISRLRGVHARDPTYGPARLALASLLSAAGDAAAAALLLNGLPPPGTNPSSWYGERARALLRLGRFAEARSALDRTRGAPPGDAALLLCVQARQLALAENEPAAAEALADRVAILADHPDAGPVEHRIDAHFELGELRHRQRRHDAAFAHWQRGHALLRPAQPFSRDAHAAVLRATTATWSRERLRHGPRSDDGSTGAVFIVGLPRTGTTLLEQVLSAHPAVHGAGERLALREELIALAGTDDAVEATSRAAASDASGLTAAGTAFLSTMRALAPDRLVILDKMPANAALLGFAAALLPGARVIHCRRDRRDVGASIYRQRFLGEHGYSHDLSDLGCYIRRHDELMAHWRDTLPIPLLELDHSEWLTDFDRTLRRVLRFLDLPYHAGCARFFEQDRDVRTASRDQVRRPINRDNVGAWRPYAAWLAPMLAELRTP